MSDLPDDPERRLTLRQAAQAPNGLAMIRTRLREGTVGAAADAQEPGANPF